MRVTEQAQQRPPNALGQAGESTQIRPPTRPSYFVIEKESITREEDELICPRDQALLCRQLAAGLEIVPVAGVEGDVIFLAERFFQRDVVEEHLAFADDLGGAAAPPRSSAKARCSSTTSRWKNRSARNITSPSTPATGTISRPAASCRQSNAWSRGQINSSSSLVIDSFSMTKYEGRVGGRIWVLSPAWPSAFGGRCCACSVTLKKTSLLYNASSAPDDARVL